jgi:hypothetical protein
VTAWPDVAPLGQELRLAEPDGDDSGPHDPTDPGIGLPDEPLRMSWRPVDLTAILAGGHDPQPAELLRRTDGLDLAYAGRVHWLSGEPEAMKSWLALHLCHEQLARGRPVVFIDYEDSGAGVVGRLLGMGLEQQHLAAPMFTYLSPEQPLNDRTKAKLEPLFSAAAVVVIDACTESLAVDGLSSKDDTDIALWLNRLPRWAARLGPAVLVLDHVVKDSDSRGRWATGSQHKLAGLDGAAYTLDAIQPGGVGMTGRSRLFLVKDRHGQVRPHATPSAGGKHWLGDLVVDSTGPWTDVVLQAPTSQPDTFIPTAVMAKVSTALAKASKALTKSEIEDRVGGRAAVVRQAIAALDDLGHLEIKPGAHNSRLHTLLRPYPDSEEPS